jgi:hypothetical protein
VAIGQHKSTQWQTSNFCQLKWNDTVLGKGDEMFWLALSQSNSSSANPLNFLSFFKTLRLKHGKGIVRQQQQQQNSTNNNIKHTAYASSPSCIINQQQPNMTNIIQWIFLGMLMEFTHNSRTCAACHHSNINPQQSKY